MEADLAQVSVGPDRALRTERSTRMAHGVAVWALLGMLVGGLAPGVALLVMPGPIFASFVITTEIIGLFSGALLGILDLPARFRGPVWRRALFAGLTGLGLALLWGALTGLAGGLGLGATMAVASPGPGLGPDFLSVAGYIGIIGASLGVVVGTVPVVAFCVVRAITLATRLPWWTAQRAAVLATAVLALPGFFLVMNGGPWGMWL